MALDVLQHATFTGPAFPDPFVRFELEKELNRLKLLPRTTGAEGRELQEAWEVYRRRLRELVARGGPMRVRHHVLEPLVARLGYARLEASPEVETREGREDGGHLMISSDGARLRAWATPLDEDLDAPSRRGRAYRFSHTRIAQRVLLAAGERVGLLTNGVELRLLISDPARPDSHLGIPIDPHWKRSREVPDTYRVLTALASPAGVQAILELVDKARLQQTRVTTELRAQARQAIERFVQGVLDHPENHEQLAAFTDKERLARDLWREGLITIYRLLFILKLESSDDPARSFSFASTSLWRNSFSPGVALARYARSVLDQGAETGRLLEDGLRTLFRMFEQGLHCSELHIAPLGGSLFGIDATPLLATLRWGEHAVAHLLDRLLWTPRRRGAASRERVHYGPLDVEDLGRVYEALLELEPGIATASMCRLRRQKLEVVVPVAQGERYQPGEVAKDAAMEDSESEDEGFTEDEEESPTRGKKTRVAWIEEIQPGRFYLRVGLGRKASGSYYTPHAFVRFLVQETLGPQVADRSSEDDPHPGEILKFNILDPAMGSGHFLVEACRFLGEKLYEACRLCDGRALEAERRVEQARTTAEREAALAEVDDYRQRIIDLPDPDDELVRYLPSRAPEGEESGLSQKKAEALCRRLVAVHCLYGVDKNPLAVELAKLALWLESHAEGLPLTFLDHRLVLGDSLTGPFFEHLFTYPGSQEPMDDLLTRGLRESFTNALLEALKQVHDLEASVGASLAEMEAKVAAKRRLDRALAPFKIAAAAWAGGVMLGGEQCDDPAYARLLGSVGETDDVPDDLAHEPRLLRMIARGLGVEAVPSERLPLFDLSVSEACIPALSYDLGFPEVFFPCGGVDSRAGFDAVLGNPPWDRINVSEQEFWSQYDLNVLDAPTKAAREASQKAATTPERLRLWNTIIETYEQELRLRLRLFSAQSKAADGTTTRGSPDVWKLFTERYYQAQCETGLLGIVIPSSFHANEGATGVRALMVENAGLRICYSFENRGRRFFDIDPRAKFDCIVAGGEGKQSKSILTRFYLHDDNWLFSKDRQRESLVYDTKFIQATGGEYRTFVELNSPLDAEVTAQAYQEGFTIGQMRSEMRIGLKQELNITRDAFRFSNTDDLLSAEKDPRTPAVLKDLIAQSLFVLDDDKTFHQYTDYWPRWRPRYLVSMTQLADRPDILEACRHYRLAVRKTTGGRNERTGIFVLLPPGHVTVDRAPSERKPQDRPNSKALLFLALVNSFPLDWLTRLKVQTDMNIFMLDSCAAPSRLPSLLAHAALRLACNHAGYEPLWHEQLDEVWREPTPPFTWPVLDGDDERWAVRAAIDAVVADAYGLSREQYAHVLSTFSHRSYSKAPELCLARYDELKTIGLEAFTRKYDPYWDIPLNQNLPEPVINLPIGEAAAADNNRPTAQPDQLSLLAAESEVSWNTPPTLRTPLSRSIASRRTAAAVADDDTYDLLKLWLEEQGVITSADAQDLTGLDAAGVRHLLKRLVDDGIAVQEGQRRGTKYRYVGRGHADEGSIC